LNNLEAARNRTTISPSMGQNALRIGLISLRFDEGTIMLGAEFGQGRGDTARTDQRG
jgi:hypothetical protein